MKQILDFFKNLLSSSDWPPRWHCGKWSEFHGWLYIISDLLIWSAYFAIPIVIIRYISRKRNILFTKLYFLFAAFILACGATHFLDAVAFWIPVYRLSALVRFITGVISWITVFYLIKYLPVIFSLRSQVALEAEIEERKKAEDALNTLNKDLELRVREQTETVVKTLKEKNDILESIGDAFFALDKNWIVTYWNRVAEENLGVKKDDIIGKKLWDAFPDSEGTLSYRNHHLAMETKQPMQFEDYYPVLNVWHEISSYPSENGLSIFFKDISARKEAEQRLKESEERFRALIENNFDIVSLNDDSLKLIYRSPSSTRITGWTNEDMMQIDGTTHIHIDDREGVKIIIQKAKENPGKSYAYAFRYLHKDGYYIRLEGTATKLPAGSIIQGLVFNSREVTEKVELELLLNKANSLARIGGWEIDLTKGTVFWSDITREIHETAQDYIPDLSTGIQFYKEGPGRELIIQKVKEAIELGNPWDVELQIITAKNNERWIRSIGETEFADGKCVRVYGSFQDIDKRKKVEEALRLSEARARRIFESDMIGFIFWSDKGQILEANDYFLNMTGYTRQDLEKGLVNWAAMTPAEYAHLDIISIKQIEATGICKPFEKEYIRKDGSRFPIILGAAALGENFEGVGVCYVMDITERKKAEIEREILNERLQLAMQSAQLGLWDWDVKNNQLVWDEGMYRLYNIAENEFSSVYEGWASRLHPEDRLRVDEDIQSALLNNKSYDPEFRIVWKDSSVHYIKASGFIEKDNEGNVVRMTGFNWDITERKKTEEKIRNINIELEQKVATRTEDLRKTNEELEAFSYSISHDLRAPLRGIIGFTNILEEDYSSKLDDEARRITAVIKHNTSKMGLLIDDLLSFSRLGRQQIVKTKVHTNEMIAEIIADTGIIKNNQTKWVIPMLPNIKADPNTIKQVWTNLISNAVKYSYKQPQPIIEIGTKPGVNETIFFVKDNGVGFDARYKDKLFKVFQRLHSATEFEGTGVGLAIVERIISKHGGKVWANGEPDKGACFYFSLPNESIGGNK